MVVFQSRPARRLSRNESRASNFVPFVHAPSNVLLPFPARRYLVGSNHYV
jgi:hypothetical protein